MNKIIINSEKIINRLNIYFKIGYLKLKYGKQIKIGKKVRFRKRLNIIIEKNGYLEIGDNNFFNNDCSINCLGKIIIGKNNLFGENVKMYDHNHVFNKNNEELVNLNIGEIVIGNYNWIGSQATILKNTVLVDRNVISAGIVVNQKLESDVILKRNDNSIIEEKIKRK